MMLNKGSDVMISDQHEDLYDVEKQRGDGEDHVDGRPEPQKYNENLNVRYVSESNSFILDVRRVLVGPTGHQMCWDPIAKHISKPDFALFLKRGSVVSGHFEKGSVIMCDALAGCPWQACVGRHRCLYIRIIFGLTMCIVSDSFHVSHMSTDSNST